MEGGGVRPQCPVKEIKSGYHGVEDNGNFEDGGAQADVEAYRGR